MVGGVCNFTLVLTGHGSFSGVYSIRDRLDIGTAQIVSMDPICRDTPAQVPFECYSPPGDQNMTDGQQLTYKVAVRIPDTTKATQLTNCAAIESDQSRTWTRENPGAYQPDSCVTVPLTPDTTPKPKYHPVDLTFKKTGPAQCQIGGICTFTLLFTSERGFFGGINLTDSMDIGPAQILSINPPMPCATEPTQLPMTCDLSSSINHVQAGQLLFYRVAVRIPGRIKASSLTNCVIWDANSSKDFLGNGFIQGAKSCATVALTPAQTPILAQPDGSLGGGTNGVHSQDPVLTLRKTGDEQCAIDGLCNFNLTISSDGDFLGPVRLSDTLDIGPASIVSIQPPLACATAPTQLPLDCDTTGQPSVQIPVGKPLTYRMTIRVPNTTATQMNNCASVANVDAELSSLMSFGLYTNPTPSCVPVTLTSADSNPAPQCFSNMVPDGKGGCGCPPGQTWDGQQCSTNTGGTNGTMPGTLQCPAGTVGIYPTCRALPPAKLQPKVLPACPAGTTGTYPNCKAVAPRAPKKLKCGSGTHPSTNGRACIPDLKPKPKSAPKALPQQPAHKAPVQNAPGFNIGGINGMPDINIGGFQMGNGGGFGGGFGGGGGGRRRHPHNDDNQAPQGGGGVVAAPPANDAPPKGGGGAVGKAPVCPQGEAFQNGRCDIVVR